MPGPVEGIVSLQSIHDVTEGVVDVFSAKNRMGDTDTTLEDLPPEQLKRLLGTDLTARVLKSGFPRISHIKRELAPIDREKFEMEEMPVEHDPDDPPSHKNFFSLWRKAEGWLNMLSAIEVGLAKGGPKDPKACRKNIEAIMDWMAEGSLTPRTNVGDGRVTFLFNEVDPHTTFLLSLCGTERWAEVYSNFQGEVDATVQSILQPMDVHDCGQLVIESGMIYGTVGPVDLYRVMGSGQEVKMLDIYEAVEQALKSTVYDAEEVGALKAKDVTAERLGLEEEFQRVPVEIGQNAALLAVRSGALHIECRQQPATQVVGPNTMILSPRFKGFLNPVEPLPAATLIRF